MIFVTNDTHILKNVCFFFASTMCVTFFACIKYQCNPNRRFVYLDLNMRCIRKHINIDWMRCVSVCVFGMRWDPHEMYTRCGNRERPRCVWKCGGLVWPEHTHTANKRDDERENRARMSAVIDRSRECLFESAIESIGNIANWSHGICIHTHTYLLLLQQY